MQGGIMQIIKISKYQLTSLNEKQKSSHHRVILSLHILHDLNIIPILSSSLLNLQKNTKFISGF